MLRPLLCTATLIVIAAAFGACSSDDQSSTGGAGAGAQGAAAGSGGAVGASGGTASGGSGASAGSGGSAPSYDCSDPGPGWLFCEDFEGMAAGYQAWRTSWGWTDHIGADDPGRMTSSMDAHSGDWAVHYPADASAGYRGADLIWRPCSGTNQPGCNLDSYDQLYFRTYLKLASDHQRVSHFLAIGGSQSFWEAYGNAGCRPNGYRHMGTTVDFDANTHNTFFYTYFPDMNCDSGSTCSNYNDPQAVCDGCAQKDMPCTGGLECCWGNHFRPSPDVALPTGQWVCFEMMMKANDVGQDNGEMAYWIDGQLAHEVTTMSWRTTADLGLNMVRLQHYIPTSSANDHANRVWFDDVVISTERIGCL